MTAFQLEIEIRGKKSERLLEDNVEKPAQCSLYPGCTRFPSPESSGL